MTDHEHPLLRLSPAQRAALADAAKRRAMQLRAQAMQAFWSAVADALRAAWHWLRQAGTRPPRSYTVH